MTNKYVNGKLLDLTTSEQAEYDAKLLTQETNRVPNWRASASLSRTNFCLALKRALILPASEAVLAARGEWPATFASALSSFPDADEHEIVWAGTLRIERASPLLETLRVYAGLSHEALDALFGWDASAQN